MAYDSIPQAVLTASRRPEVAAAVDAVYADLAAQVAQRRPACSASGRCCRFEEFGHRLYVTTLELAAFLSQVRLTASIRPEETHADGQNIPPAVPRLPLLASHPTPASLDALIAQWDQTGCPFQLKGLCSVHLIRPFGCRIFFCDPTAQQWQESLYETLHARLKQLHVEFNVPYFYLEWRQALRDIILPVLIAED